MYTLKELIDQLLNIKKLPTLPPVIFILEKSLNVKEPDVHRVSRIISDDPPLTSALLKLANSVMYTARRKTTTVQEAIVRLGFKEIRKLVFDVGMVRYVSALPKGLIDPQKFWEHSIGVAFCMEEIQLRTGIRDHDGSSAHVVGLLHDLGRLISATYLPDVHQNLPDNEQSEDPRKSILDLEAQRIGIDHTQIAAAVLERWGLPLEIVNCVRFHHQPDVAPKIQRKDIYLLHLADSICRIGRVGDSGEGRLKEIKQAVWDTLGLESARTEEILVQVREKIKNSGVLSSIIGIKS